jgi:hypothetical protein
MQAWTLVLDSIERGTSRRSSERKGTRLYRSGRPRDGALAPVENRASRDGARAVSRLLGVHRDAAVRHGRLLGEDPRQMHDMLVVFCDSARLEITSPVPHSRLSAY